MNADTSMEFDEFDIAMRPEILAGGYSRDDSTVDFYQRVTALTIKNAIILDLGAGRGAQLETARSEWRRWLIQLGKRYAKRIGVDVDPAVLENPLLDEAFVIDPALPLPFPDESFDVVLSDWVVEHVDNPAAFFKEVKRILKVGGWFCARTPNKWSYFSIGARLIPEKGHSKVLGQLQGNRKDIDVFPKFYRLNTLAALRKQLPTNTWLNASYTHNPAPAYHGKKRLIFKAIEVFQRLLPKSKFTVIHIFAKRLN